MIKSFGSGDPLGQYGGFSLTNTGKYRPKSAIVTDAGKSLDKVIGITLLTANEDTGGGTRIVDCPFQPQGQTYSYCVHTAGDLTGDSVDVGVTERP